MAYFCQTLVGGLCGGVADGSGLALDAELVWSATADEVSAAMVMTNVLGVWRFVARVARELLEANVWSWQFNGAVDGEVAVVGGSSAVSDRDSRGEAGGGGGCQQLCGARWGAGGR